jgi:hypothetical protein
MAKYRKKPVIIDAEIYHDGMEDGWELKGRAELESKLSDNIIVKTFPNSYRLPVQNYVPYIRTLEGRHYISKGDFIITGIKGERYPCKPDIFEQTYEDMPDLKERKMDSVIKVIRDGETIRIDIENFTVLAMAWTADAVYKAILQASMNIPNISFIINDNSDEYYKAINESLEKRIKSIRNLLPNIEIKVETDIKE